ncbi:hypothetical protein QVH35_08230 [Candidatus Nitrosotenuis chungbukensis]|uniref:hypothetical protein n=1 Tax=Candidatus Nitrosotenuis chungbukensis TaxID=1353246 RepID=UPI002673F1E1|nr:hypothetical protein [Candidatus Nitrosotenuis chungbukensis]WKT57380.1 hypothetical protein QVH35_08230 [Candidatus Nitrosotenuis chungbukensis]
MNFEDLKEKCILVGVSAGIFLPFRLLVSQYFAEHWLGNLGFATACVITDDISGQEKQAWKIW